ncbi:MAG: SH3 domain-containing protein [Syntrophomonadaceae bacterium]|nr:SH3 domain-containing protein [Syntrophomonadaceae bacterium]
MSHGVGRFNIRNLLVMLVLSITMVLALYNVALASTATITGSVVNIRSGPGTDYAVDGNLLKDTEVRILQSQGDWYKISRGSLTGWVSKSLLEVKQVEQVKIVGDPVNLRSGPGTDYEVLDQARKGDLLTLLGATGEWYQVQNADGLTCYVVGYLAEKLDADAGSGPAQEGAGTAKPSPAPSSQNPVVYLDGKKLSFDVEPIIENSRTMVPIRAIFEALGAKVEWDNDTRTVTAVKGSTTVVLPIGSTKPTVNGQVWPLDVAAKISQSRTLAPLRFVGEALGSTVSWEAATRTVSISSKSTQDVHSVVVNESKVNLRNGPSTQHNAIASALQGERLAVLAEKDGWYQVSRSGTTAWVASWVVNAAQEEEQPNQNGTPPANPDTDPVEPVDPVDPGNISNDEMWISSTRNNDGIRIEMESTSPIKPSIDKSGQQITYKIKNKKIMDNTGISQSIGPGKMTLTVQNWDDITTIKINLPAGTEYYTASENGGKREVLVIPNQIIKIIHEAADANGESVIIQTLAPSEFISNKSGDILEIKLKTTAMGLEQTRYTYSDSPIIKQMDFSQTGQVDPWTTVKIDTRGMIDYRIFSTKDDNSINIVLLADAESIEQEDRTDIVVLDAGHGGKESGAIGFGVQEKDINLAITLMAGKILEDNGVNVSYTRSDDSYLTLTERAEYANNLNAALFVCIHNNSFTSPEAHGTETYYYAPISDLELIWQKEERARLAESIQNQLVKTLGRTNRGVKQYNYTVLVKTKMPSALTEVSFISNPTENELLCNKNYQERAAEAIAQGILEYLGK